jgi:hypothetical protein
LILGIGLVTWSIWGSVVTSEGRVKDVLVVQASCWCVWGRRWVLFVGGRGGLLPLSTPTQTCPHVIQGVIDVNIQNSTEDVGSMIAWWPGFAWSDGTSSLALAQLSSSY